MPAFRNWDGWIGHIREGQLPPDFVCETTRTLHWLVHISGLKRCGDWSWDRDTKAVTKHVFQTIRERGPRLSRRNHNSRAELWGWICGLVEELVERRVGELQANDGGAGYVS